MKRNLLVLGTFLFTTIAGMSAAEPLIVAPEDGGDITAALNAAKEGVAEVGDITINLAAGGKYTVSGSLETSGALVINGNGATVSAKDLTSSFVLMSQTPSVAVDEKGFYAIGNVEFRNVNVTELSQQLFYANKTKYLIPALVTDSCQIQLAGGNKNIYDFNGGGVTGILDIRCSTINSTPANTGTLYSSQSGDRATDAGLEVQTLSITNSTLYNIANGKNVCTHRSANQKWLKYVVKDNVILDCGKKGQFVKGLNGGQGGGNPTYEVDNNSFLWTTDGVVAVEPEAEPAEGTILNSIGEPTSTFPQAAEGIFTLDATSAQAKCQVGDPRWLVAYEVPPTPVVLNLTEATDISTALAAAMEGIEKVGDITINLTGNTTYTLSGSIVAPASVRIYGNGATIDASALEVPMILMSETPSVMKINDYYRVDAVRIDSVTVRGLKNSIFYDNNFKYCVVDFSITNSNISLATTAVENEALISFKSGGAKDVTIVNNTIYGNGEVAKYFMRFNNSARLDRFGFDKEKDTQLFTYQSNTFYKTIKSDGQWGNYGGLNGQKFVKFDLQKNIWFDSSSDIVRRLSGGRVGSSGNVFDYNTYFNGGVSVGDSNDKGTILVTDPEFKDPMAGDFTIGAGTQQAKYQTGASEWLVEFVAPDVTEIKAALLAEINAATELLGDDVESEAGIALKAAIDNAREVYDNAEFAMEIEAAIEALKKAEADYQTSGIAGIGADGSEAAVEYFNLQGIRVENPSAGIYLRRQGSSVTKVIVK